MNRCATISRPLVAVLAASLIRVETALAQPSTDTGVAIEEIVVTAQKREEPARDVPISIVALDREALSFRGIREVGDLQLAVPGLAFGRDGSGGQQIAIRGIGLEVTNSTVEVPIATYVDGVYQTRSFRRANLGLDLQRIEVLRGPQGTLFGRNATGGALNIVLAEPTARYTGSARLAGGSFDAVLTEVMASGPLLGDRVKGRVAANFEHHGGDVKNLVTDESVNDFNSGSMRAALRVDLLADLTADVSFLYDRASGGGLAPSSVNIKVGDPELELASGTSPPTASMPDTFIEGRHPHEAKLNRDNDGRARNWQLASSLVWELPFASIKSITAFQDHSLFATYDGDGTARDLLFFSHREDFSRALTQEINLLGTTEWFTWLLGTHFLDESFVSEWDPIELPEFGSGSGALVGVIGREQVKSISGFGDATVVLPKGFNLFGGVRFTHDEKKLDQDDSFRLASAPDVRLPIEGVDCRLSFEAEFDDLSPRYGIQWDGEWVNVYAKRSYGYTAGGHYPFNCDNPYQDEKVDQIEAGVKSSWFGGRLVANASVFRSAFENFQIFKVIGAGARLINAPEARMRGAELEAAALPIERLRLDLGVSLLDAEYVRFEDTDVANPAAGEQNLAGNEFNRAPDYTISMGAEYGVPISLEWPRIALRLDTLRLRVEWYRTDDIVLRPYGRPLDSQPGYDLVNAIASVSSPGGGFRLRVFGKNLTYSRYFGWITAFSSGQYVGVAGGPPRHFGADATLSF